MEASAPAQRLTVGQVIGETFSIYGRNLGLLLGSAFVLFLIVGIITALLAGPSRNDLSFGDLMLVLLAIIIRVAAQALYTGFVVRVVEDDRDGRRDRGVGDLLRSAGPAIGPLVVMSILFGLGVGIGLMLFVIPGLVLLTIWAVTAPAIVVEGRGALDSFGRSRELIRGHGWTVFWTIVVVWLLTALIIWVFGEIGDQVSDVGYGVGVSIGNFVTAPIHALAVSVIFFAVGGGRAASPAAGSPSAGSTA